MRATLRNYINKFLAAPTYIYKAVSFEGRNSHLYVLEEGIIIVLNIYVVCQWRNSGEPNTGQGERISHHSQTPTFPGHCPGDALSPWKWNAAQVSWCADV